MISTDEHNPVVGFPESSGHLVVHSFIISRLLEAETTVTGNDKKGILQAVLDAQFEDNTLEVPVDIPGDENLLCVGIFENLAHFSAFLIWFSIFSFTCRKDTGL